MGKCRTRRINTGLNSVDLDIRQPEMLRPKMILSQQSPMGARPSLPALLASQRPLCPLAT